MSSPAQFLNPSAAARRLGVSAKALRLYEQHGLITPSRTAAGWRIYGPEEMTRTGEIVILRALGLSLFQVARVLGDDPEGLEPALAAHQAILEGRIRQLAGTVEKVRDIRAGLAQGKPPTSRELARLMRPIAEFSVAFDLPWPWGGERFELSDVRPLNYIIGPLGSGKTRLAKCLAEALPDAVFLGLDRLEHGGAAARAQLDADPTLKSRVDQCLAWLVEDGTAVSEALVALLGEARLELSKLNALDDAGAVAVQNVSLTVRGGEIVGIAGVSGNGQRQLVEVLAGQREVRAALRINVLFLIGVAIARILYWAFKTTRFSAAAPCAWAWL